MLRELIYKNSATHLNDLSKQYLKYQTPYSPLMSKSQIAYEKRQDETAQNIAKTDNEEANFAKIVIIIDDMGINSEKTKQISDLRYPLNVSFLTYAPHLQKQIKQSQNSGQEIMIHVPMEPHTMQNYTEQMLTTDMTDEEIVKILETILQQVPQAVGINNHMGSKFTEDEHRMGVIMQVLAEKGIIFVDSRTSAKTSGYKQAQFYGVKFFVRDIFLDNKDDYDYITSQLQKVEKIAHKTGFAVAIGHPKEQTYQALKDWLPSLEDKGIKLVHISKINNHEGDNYE